MSKPVWIYGLCDPDTKEVRYIGKTVNLRERPARWEITFPDGRVERCRNLTAWAREHGYGLNRIYAAAQGKQPHYAGLEIRGLA